MRDIAIAGRKVGIGYPCFIIAEAGVNHNGDIETAYKLIDVAVEAGVDAVKFQTFKAEKGISKHTPKADYQKRSTGEGGSMLEMVKKLELPFEAFKELYKYCQRKKILFMSTPFDHEAIDFLDNLGISVYKVPSGEITNLPYLSHISKKGKPMIISTGMSNLGEVEIAIKTIKDAGNSDIALLHCVSNYPANPADINLRAMKTMEVAFDVPVGFSDHSLGIEIAIAAVALGACVIEKHFTLDKSLSGPDHQASLGPDELAKLVSSIRLVESALGNGEKVLAASEANTAQVARKSLVAACRISAGTKLTMNHIAAKRPGTGLSPSMLTYLLDRSVRRDVEEDELLDLEMLA